MNPDQIDGTWGALQKRRLIAQRVNPVTRILVGATGGQWGRTTSFSSFLVNFVLPKNFYDKHLYFSQVDSGSRNGAMANPWSIGDVNDLEI